MSTGGCWTWRCSQPGSADYATGGQVRLTSSTSDVDIVVDGQRVERPRHTMVLSCRARCAPARSRDTVPPANHRPTKGDGDDRRSSHVSQGRHCSRSRLGAGRAVPGVRRPGGRSSRARAAGSTRRRWRPRPTCGTASTASRCRPASSTARSTRPALPWWEGIGAREPRRHGRPSPAPAAASCSSATTSATARLGAFTALGAAL